MYKRYFLLLYFLGLLVNFSLAQEIFLNIEDHSEVLFLGSYNETSLKVLDSSGVKYVDRVCLDQVDELSCDSTVKIIEMRNLYFECEGDQPFWTISLFKDKVALKDYGNNGEKEYRIDLVTSNDNSFTIMLYGLNSNTVGLIHKVDYKLNFKDACDESITEEYNVYTGFFSIDNQIYRGCCKLKLK